ncbi:hypothetical protein [Mycobacterium sp. 236(2023)]|uniref:hypothetical protein n=1 Tax=Mycobacterium sp. 236(2023) TaxID=3038163 RepID=UPI00241554BF|nr:hypothetical protein [Mycobacterium sp. 236(2023)]MDG4665884.1 hypothetical protein [Mycobacterium sp. 236(2023)]
MTRAEVAPLEARYPSARWSRKAFDALTLMDGGSRSPEETMVRLWLIDAGLPRPQTGISVGDRIWEAKVGIGWPEFRIGVQWAEHRYNLVSDIHFRDLLRRLRWQLIEVGRHHSRANVIKRRRDALLCRPLC